MTDSPLHFLAFLPFEALAEFLAMVLELLFFTWVGFCWDSSVTVFLEFLGARGELLDGALWDTMGSLLLPDGDEAFSDLGMAGTTASESSLAFLALARAPPLEVLALAGS